MTDHTEQLRELWTATPRMSEPDIARMLNITPRTVSKIARRIGLPYRGSGVNPVSVAKGVATKR
ncbi:MAG: hypothetical protein KGL39_30445, partial [Patescibacteria group bacterium]|nr:hypothetical protein [Patescibacteria group bacterium]